MKKINCKWYDKIGFKSMFIAGLLLLQSSAWHVAMAEEKGSGLVGKALQQKQNITGVVTDDVGEIVPGVSIVIKGTTTGTITDIDGRYNIEANQGDVLVFSFVGLTSQEVVVGRQTIINVVLKSELIGLDDVVVVGYGVQKKATLTGSIETVSAKAFEDVAVTSPALALQGQTPGLVVSRGSSRPGNEDINFQIRGATSVNGGVPLIVIDGVPTINKEAFYNMNSDDIESISILKDGSAAIYGTRAANGVILVTTKRGKGKLKVDFTSNLRVSTVGIRPPTPTMQQYATVWLEAADQDGQFANYWNWDTRENLELMQSEYEGIYATKPIEKGGWGNVFIGNYPRFDEMYGASFSNQENLSLSGSTDKSNYRVSAGYSENVGSLQTAYDGKKQYNIRFNYDYKLTDWIKLETSVSYNSSHVSSPSGGLGVTSISNDPPFFPSKNPYGQWYANFNIAGNRNSVAQTVDGGRENTYRDQLQLNFAATVNLYKDLNFKATASIDNDFYNYQKYNVTVPQYTWYGEQSAETVNAKSDIREEFKKTSYNTFGGFFNYKKDLSNHHFSAMVGTSAEINENKRLYGYRKGFEDYGVYDLELGSIDQKVENEGGSGNWGLYSYIGRLNYNYKEKYLFEVNGRSDGSSKFDIGFKWKNFVGGSVGWVLSEEEFMKSVTPISFLKLRASYGEIGNQEGIHNHDYLSLIGYGSSIFGTTAAQQQTASANSITSNVRTWERVSIANYGMDFRLLNNKMFGSFDYYKKKNDEMLINVNYPDILGGEAPTSNNGTLETKGWEAMLGWRSQIGDLKFNVSVNMSNSKNELVYMEGELYYNAGLNKTVQGYALNSYFLYETDGFFANEDEITAYYNAYNNGGEILSITDADRIRVGDTKKVDLDNNGKIVADGNVNDKDGDVKYMGDNAPHYNFGVNLGAQYKNFDFSAFFQGSLDQNVMRTGYSPYPFYQVWTNHTAAYIGKTWTETNTGAAYPRMTANTTRAKWNYQNNDFMLENNRYVRLKSLVVGYTFSDLKIVKYNLQKLRIYFSGNDLFEFTKVKDGYDPEFGESTNSSYPFTRTWSMGVNVSF